MEAILKKKRRFTQGGDFCRQPDFSLPMDKLSKKVISKTPRGVHVLGCLPVVYIWLIPGKVKLLLISGKNQLLYWTT